MMRLVLTRPTYYCAKCGGALFCLTPNALMDARYQCLTPECERKGETLEIVVTSVLAKIVEEPGIDPLATGSN